MVEKKQAEKEESVSVKIHFRIPTRMPSLYAHHMFAQQDDAEVILSFFEVISPIILPGDEEQAFEAMKQTGVTAECIARITIAKQRFPAFAKAIATFAKDLQAQTEEVNNADDRKDNRKNK